MTNHSAIADDDLMRMSVAGDVEAFSEVARRHYPNVRRFAATLTKDDFAADDVAQEAFISAYNGIHRYTQANKLRPWLLSITRQRFCVYLKKMRMVKGPKNHILSIDAPVSDTPKSLSLADTMPYVENTAEPDIPNSHLLPLVPVALSRLKPKHAEPLNLLFYGGASKKEIAALNNLSNTAMRSRIDTALRYMKRELTIMERPPDTAPAAKQYLSNAEAALALGISPSTLYLRVKAGILPAHRSGLRKIVFLAADIEQAKKPRYSRNGNKALAKYYRTLFGNIYNIVCPDATQGQKKPPQSVLDVGPRLAQG